MTIGCPSSISCRIPPFNALYNAIELEKEEVQKSNPSSIPLIPTLSPRISVFCSFKCRSFFSLFVFFAFNPYLFPSCQYTIILITYIIIIILLYIIIDINYSPQFPNYPSFIPLNSTVFPRLFFIYSSIPILSIIYSFNIYSEFQIIYHFFPLVTILVYRIFIM